MSGVKDGFRRGSWLIQDELEGEKVLDSDVIDDWGGNTSNVWRTRAIRSRWEER